MDLSKALHNRELKPTLFISNIISKTLEDSFCANYDCDHPFDFLKSPSGSISTIAIALSSDGLYVASSHGDHTIKVFLISSGQLYRNFRGHPRTPWTVKFNPNDSNIVASGCLGFEVRVWDIQRNVCLNVIRLSSCIITIAFRPQGDFIMISSGTLIKAWEWREGMASVYGGYPEESAAPDTVTPAEEQANQQRNKAGSLPSRLYVFNFFDTMFIPPPVVVSIPTTALPSLPATITSLSMFSDVNNLSHATTVSNNIATDSMDTTTTITINNMISDINNNSNDSNILETETDSSPNQPVNLSTLPTAIAEIHLYSDGGLDVSKDGMYLIAGVSAYIYIRRDMVSVGISRAIDSNKVNTHLQSLYAKLRANNDDNSNNNNNNNSFNENSNGNNANMLNSSAVFNQQQPPLLLRRSQSVHTQSNSNRYTSSNNDEAVLNSNNAIGNVNNGTNNNMSLLTSNSSTMYISPPRIQRSASTGHDSSNEIQNDHGQQRQQQKHSMMISSTPTEQQQSSSSSSLFGHRFNSPPLQIRRSNSNHNDDNDNNSNNNNISTSASNINTNTIHNGINYNDFIISSTNQSTTNNNINHSRLSRQFRQQQYNQLEQQQQSSSLSISQQMSQEDRNEATFILRQQALEIQEEIAIKEQRLFELQQQLASVTAVDTRSTSSSSSLLHNNAASDTSSLSISVINTSSNNDINNNNTTDNSSNVSATVKTNEYSSFLDSYTKSNIKANGKRYFANYADFNDRIIRSNSGSSSGGSANNNNIDEAKSTNGDNTVAVTSRNAHSLSPTNSSGRQYAAVNKTAVNYENSVNSTNIANNNINNTGFDYDNIPNNNHNSLLNRIAAVSNSIHNRRPNIDDSERLDSSSSGSGSSSLFGHSHPSSSSSSSFTRISSNIHNNQNINSSFNIHNRNNSNNINHQSSSNISDNDAILSIHKPIFVDPRTKTIITSSNSNASASNDGSVMTVPYDMKQYTDQVMLCLFKIILPESCHNDGDGISTDNTNHNNNEQQQLGARTRGGVIMELIQHRNISANLMKAVTSLKFSPTGRSAILGYGVRKGGQVEDHPSKTAACEVIKFKDEGNGEGRQYTKEAIRSVALITNINDEVNIAQFHATPGYGVIYGTKQGKVRLFHQHKDKK